MLINHWVFLKLSKLHNFVKVILFEMFMLHSNAESFSLLVFHLHKHISIKINNSKTKFCCDSGHHHWLFKFFLSHKHDMFFPCLHKIKKTDVKHVNSFFCLHNNASEIYWDIGMCWGQITCFRSENIFFRLSQKHWSLINIFSLFDQFAFPNWNY